LEVKLPEEPVLGSCELLVRQIPAAMQLGQLAELVRCLHRADRGTRRELRLTLPGSAYAL
jgi:hypothetical protein